MVPERLGLAVAVEVQGTGGQGGDEKMWLGGRSSKGRLSMCLSRYAEALAPGPWNVTGLGDGL